MVKFIGITTAGKFLDFQGPLLLFKDFPGLEFYFSISRIFQDFQGPWEPLTVVLIVLS